MYDDEDDNIFFTKEVISGIDAIVESHNRSMTSNPPSLPSSQVIDDIRKAQPITSSSHPAAAKEINKLKEEILILNSKLEQSEKMANTVLNSVMSSNGELNSSITTLQGKVHAKEQLIMQLTDKLKRLEGELEAQKILVSKSKENKSGGIAAESKKTISRLEKEVAELTSQLHNATSTISGLREDLIGKEEHAKSCEVKIDELKLSCVQLQKNKSELEDITKKLKQEILDKGKAEQRLTKQRTELESTIKSLREENQKLKSLLGANVNSSVVNNAPPELPPSAVPTNTVRPLPDTSESKVSVIGGVKRKSNSTATGKLPDKGKLYDVYGMTPMIVLPTLSNHA